MGDGVGVLALPGCLFVLVFICTIPNTLTRNDLLDKLYWDLFSCLGKKIPRPGLNFIPDLGIFITPRQWSR